MLAALQTLSKAWDGVRAHIGGLNDLIPHTRPSRRRCSPSRTANAAVESGTHPPGRPGLRFRNQEHPGLIAPRIGGAVQVFPAHGGDLSATHGGFDGRAQWRPEGARFVGDEAAGAGTGELGALTLDEVHGICQGGLHAPGRAGRV